MDERNRLSFGSDDWQTLQLQAIIGTPCDVPVPKNVICTLNFNIKINLLPYLRCIISDCYRLFKSNQALA